MSSRRLAPIADVAMELDATTLLGDDHPRRVEPSPTRCAPTARPPRMRATLAASPAPAERVPAGGRRRDSGRDPLLSVYLASLGRHPLLGPEDERRLAAGFRDAERACWGALLALAPLGAVVLEHRHLVEASAAQREAVTRAVGAPEHLDAAFGVLRELDDDRSAMGEILAQCRALIEATRGGSRTNALVAAHVETACRARRRALEIRNQFVRANLRLVVSVARRFHHHRLPLIDLVQEGNLGLIKSVHRFDHTRGFRFSTYAHWWIRQAIERAVMNKGAQIRLPVHVFDARREVARVTRDLQARLGREPALEEVARALGLPLERVAEVVRTVPREPVSLDELTGDDDDRALGDILADPDAVHPDDHVAAVHAQRAMRRVLAKLTPMEVDILRRRFGLDVHEDETLEEIGRSYHLSRERVRQLQVQGLNKLRDIMESRQRAR